MTYIQSAAGWPLPWPRVEVNVAAILTGTLAIITVAVGLLFGLIVRGSVGFAVLISCSLLGAGILTMVAASCISSS
jgi:hypothetical protein